MGPPFGDPGQPVERAGADHRLHFLDVPDDVCKARLRARNAAGTHAFEASDAEFDLFTSYFVPPSPDEGFEVTLYGFAPEASVPGGDVAAADPQALPED
mgnify:CR=1 FL=1